MPQDGLSRHTGIGSPEAMRGHTCYVFLNSFCAFAFASLSAPIVYVHPLTYRYLPGPNGHSQDDGCNKATRLRRQASLASYHCLHARQLTLSRTELLTSKYLYDISISYSSMQARFSSTGWYSELSVDVITRSCHGQPLQAAVEAVHTCSQTLPRAHTAYNSRGVCIARRRARTK